MTANVYGVTLSTLLDWINVQAGPYHADPTGTTDATAAIAAAIAAVPSTGGVVYLPSGTYLLNSNALSLLTAGTVLLGAGAESTKLIIGSGFTGSAAVSVTAYNCQIRDLSIRGASSTTTSNPTANGVEITGVRRAKVSRCTFFNINGWAIEAAATTASSTSNPLGTQLDQLFVNSCAGGVHFLGSTTQGYAMNSQVTDLQFYGGGATSGPNANLDAIKIEDAWDVLVENAIVWMTNGTGSCLHIKGTSAATFVTNLDALGPHTGPCVLIEDGPNGSPQNTQIQGGVIQQGAPGLLITGGAFQTHISTSRLINNQTHGIQVAGTGKPVHLYNCMFNLNGQGSSGTNYDVDWSGTAQGKVLGCWFGSSIVATSAAGVQESINIASAGQAVLVAEAAFQGTGAAAANWFTNLPAGVLEASAGAINFPTAVTLGGGVTVVGQTTTRPASSGSTALSTNVGGGDPFDRFRLLASGSQSWGPGSATRDTTLSRPSGGGLQLTQPSGLVETLGGVVQEQTSTVTVANTAAATALTSYTVPANDPATGSVYMVEGYGVYSTTGTPTLQVVLYWGGTAGTVLASVPAITTPSGITNGAFRYSATVTFRSTTAAVGMLTVHLDTSTSTGQVTSYLATPSSPTTVTTTTAEALTVGATWGTASASNTISLLGGHVRRLA